MEDPALHPLLRKKIIFRLSTGPALCRAFVVSSFLQLDQVPNAGAINPTGHGVELVSAGGDDHGHSLVALVVEHGSPGYRDAQVLQNRRAQLV